MHEVDLDQHVGRRFQLTACVQLQLRDKNIPVLIEQRIFRHEARCSTCHRAPSFTDVTSAAADTPFLHDPEEVGTDPRYAHRSATGGYRTTPLRALWQHPPYFHDGSAADLRAVVDHYDEQLDLELGEAQKNDLIEYLKSL